ncbi:MAG: hypothetical protein N2315_09200, partial [Thermanaerothrix sp.]|nr:hypothetical protein [Thermanaerothrix sp.]
NQYQAMIKTSVAFLNVAEGKTIGMANITTTGNSRETQTKAIREAIDAIPVQLTYEVRKIPAFTLRTQVLQVKGGDVKMQFGQDMGVVKGDEYIVVSRESVGGLVDEQEVGLVVVKEVGLQVATASIRYANKGLVEGAQLVEVPRLGADIGPYLMYLKYFNAIKDSDGDTTNGTLAIGAKIPVTRGFYDVRPVVGIQVNLDPFFLFPLIAYGGVEYNLYMGRLAITGTAAFAGGSNYLVQWLEEQLSTSDDKWFTHYGIKLNGEVSYLVSRDMLIFVNVGMDYMLGVFEGLGGFFKSFGGTGIAAGVTFKL